MLMHLIILGDEVKVMIAVGRHHVFLSPNEAREMALKLTDLAVRADAVEVDPYFEGEDE